MCAKETTPFPYTSWIAICMAEDSMMISFQIRNIIGTSLTCSVMDLE